MNVILILMDSLNRHFLPCYGNSWVKTPHIDRLAEKGVVFDHHYMGSAPCIPARRDLWTGRREFMWRGWGPVEPFDTQLPTEMSRLGAHTGIVTDHYHYWDGSSAYGYIQGFTDMQMIRGQEYDTSGLGAPALEDLPLWAQSIADHRSLGEAYWFYRNSLNYEREEDFSTPRVMAGGADWLEQNGDRDGFFLQVECFDPHEPFFAPEPYRSMYGPVREDVSIWPPYGSEDAIDRFLKAHSPEELAYIRQQYAACLTMADRHLGRIWAVMDQKQLWENTMVILTSDHGHDLGDHQTFGKRYPHWRTHAHLPLLVWHPRFPGNGRRAKSFSTMVDIHSTIMEAMGNEKYRAVHGRSLMPVIKGDAESVRDFVLYGVFGLGVCMTNRHFTFMSGYDNSHPLFLYSCHQAQGYRLNWVDPEKAVSDRHLPGVSMPLWRMPSLIGHFRDQPKKPPMIFAAADEEQRCDLAGDEKQLVECRKELKAALEEERVPPEQFDRLML